MRNIDRYWNLRDKEYQLMQEELVSFPSVCAWPLIEPRGKRWVIGFTGVANRLHRFSAKVSVGFQQLPSHGV